MSPEAEAETTVDETYSVTVPAAVRREGNVNRLGAKPRGTRPAPPVDAGDKLRWRVDADGTLSIELVKQRYGALSRLDAVDIGDPTDAAADHDYSGEEQ